MGQCRMVRMRVRHGQINSRCIVVCILSRRFGGDKRIRPLRIAARPGYRAGQRVGMIFISFIPGGFYKKIFIHKYK
jgi:hypothetical protein